jgi:hypothetical protein
MDKLIKRICHDVKTIEIVLRSEFIKDSRKIKRINELVKDLKNNLELLTQEEK